MPAAVSLLDAAGLAEINLRPRWQNDTLQARMIAFWQSVNATFPDETPNNHPVGNWIAVIGSFSPSILPFAQAPGIGRGTVTTFQKSVDHIYRLFKLANAQQAAGLITVAQGNTLLAAYNAQFP